MDSLSDELENQINALVTRISKLEPSADQPEAFAALDKRLIQGHATLRAQYEAARRIEESKRESQQLDLATNNTLIELAEYRKQLEQRPANVDTPSHGVDSDVLLDYASRITRFTKQIPGTVDPTVLPWPAEDQLRKGMLATLTIQDEAGSHAPSEAPEPAHREPSGHEHAEPQIGTHPKPATKPEGEPRPVQAAPTPKKKINLDFDSDED